MSAEDKSRIEKIEPRQAAEEIRALLYRITRHIDLIIHCIVDNKFVINQNKLEEHKENINTIFLIIQASGVSIHSILNLTQEIGMSIRDCFGIARSATEAAVNACYILAAGEEAAGRARRHSLQKSYRILHRSYTLAGVGLEVWREGDFDIDSIPGLRDALNEYTNKNGREIQEWTNVKIREKIEYIANKYPNANLPAAMAVFSIYDDASQILHGSYFGVELFWRGGAFGHFDRKKCESMFVLNHFVAIYGSIFASVMMLSEVIDYEFNVPPVVLERKQLLKDSFDLLVPGR